MAFLLGREKRRGGEVGKGNPGAWRPRVGSVPGFSLANAHVVQVRPLSNGYSFLQVKDKGIHSFIHSFNTYLSRMYHGLVIGKY